MGKRPNSFEAYNADQQAILERVAKVKVTQLPKMAAYSTMLETWSTKASGPKPTFELKLATLLCPTKRGVSEQAHLAMLNREHGCVEAEHKQAGLYLSGQGFGPANNYVWHVQTGLCAAGMAVRYFEPVNPGSKSYRNWLRVTPKGFKLIETELAKVESAVKVKPARKAKAVTIQPVTVDVASEVAAIETPISDAPSAIEQLTV